MGQLLVVDSAEGAAEQARLLSAIVRGRVRAAQATTVTSQVLSRAVREHDVRSVLQAFSLAFGRLPGVRIPSGPRPPIADGTEIVGLVARIHDHIPRRQRRAVDAVLTRLNAAARAAVRRAAGSAARVSRDQDLRDVTAAYRFYLERMNLPSTPALRIAVGSMRGAPGLEAETFPIEFPTLRGCAVLITPDGDRARGIERLWLLAHEAFHCVQFHVIDRAARFYRQPGWAAEGGATWAACSYVRATSSSDAQLGLDHYRQWAATPRIDRQSFDLLRPLMDRDYDAVGFFSLIQATGRDPYGFFPSFIAASTNGDAAAYEAAGGDQPEVLHRWAALYYADRTRGPDWAPAGACATRGASGPQRTLEIGAESSVPERTGAYTADPAVIKPEGADIITITRDSGDIRVNGVGIGGDMVDQSVTGTAEFCVRLGGCTCPPGEVASSAAPGQTLDPLRGPIYLAVTGGSAGGFATVKGRRFTCTRASSTIYIRVKITESYDHLTNDGSEHWSSTATTDTLHQTSAADLQQQNSQIPSVQLLSSTMSATTVEGPTTCKWSGSLVSGSEPHLSLAQQGGRLYGLIAWPDMLGPAWGQTLTQGGSGCPTYASFSPTQGSVVTRVPSGDGFSSMDHFYNAIFPISPTGSGQSPPVTVCMKSNGDIPGETDKTNASGQVTIGYGRAPSPPAGNPNCL
ncbi:MAG: hypothetical protein ACXVFQ_18385 [Solirubrobacteraceae bacterium]